MTNKTFPTSFAQRRLWFLDQLEPGSPAYNVPRALRLSGLLDERALSLGFRALVDRHESLRSIFTFGDGEPQQVVLSELKVELDVIDLMHHSLPEREAEAFRIAGEESRKPFDLTEGPLLRTKLLRLAPEDHILVLVMHHIVTDGWSIGILLRELADLYDSFSRGHEAQLPDLPIQYSDFSQWQRQHVNGEMLFEQLRYWKKHLAGAETVLDFPYDHPRPETHSGLGGAGRFQLDRAMCDKLKALARDENATLFMVLLGAFQTLLWRYTSQDSILVGTPIAGRSEPELEKTVGLFVNTVVLRADFASDPTFKQLLGQIRSNTLEAIAHQDVPFEKLVEELHPDRVMSRTPLFQVMLVSQNVPRPRFELPGLLVEEVEFDTGIAKVDLTLDILELDQLYCTLEYSADLFEPETIERLIVHFQRLVASISDDPGAKLSLLPMLSEAERDQFRRWNNTEANYPCDLCIHTAFEQQTARTPDAFAIISNDCQITFRQLNECANGLAHRLITHGVTLGCLVGVAMERSPDMVAALLAILKTGAAYVPLDSSYPKERLNFLIEDSQVACVITDTATNELFSLQHPSVRLINAERVTTSEHIDNPCISVSAESRAYVIYTSGSTGTPKGVQGTHRASVNRFDWMWKAYPFTASDTCCQKTPLCFIDSVWEVFGPLLHGVRTVLIPDDAMENPDRLVQILSAKNVSRIVLVPSLLRLLLEQIPNLQSKLPNLILWSSSGESLNLELARRFQKELPNAKLLNIYGSSEVAADVAWHEVTNHERGGSVPIGRPIQNVQLFVLDRHLQPVPPGVRGEIYVGGQCLALGYWKRPELTAERFIRNPYAKDVSTRLYKTGDLGRYFPNGEIEYLGRTDSQVKLRGMRVELGEIECQLIAHPQVRDAAVLAADHTPDHDSLIAYVCAIEPRTITAPDLRRYLKSKLPEPLIPSQLTFLEKFPTLPSGKVDRRALALLKPTLEREYVAPRTDVEKKLADIWLELLSVDRVSVDDNFFEAGGNSLMALRVAARIRRAFELDIPIRSLFEEPTISGLACELEKAKANGKKTSRPMLARQKHDCTASNKEVMLGTTGTSFRREATANADSSA